MLREGRLQRLVWVQGTRLMAEITAVIPYTCVALGYLHRGVVGSISHHLQLEIERCSLRREPRDGTLAFPKLPLGERLETIVLALGAGQRTVLIKCLSDAAGFHLCKTSNKGGSHNAFRENLIPGPLSAVFPMKAWLMGRLVPWIQGFVSSLSALEEQMLITHVGIWRHMF